MENWVTVLLFLFFFIILPLLQGISQRRKGAQEPEHAEQQEGWEAAEPEPVAPGRRDRVPAWDDWDEPEQEKVEAAPAPSSAWEDLALDDLFQDRPVEPRPERRPEPARTREPRTEPVRETRGEVPVTVPAPATRPSPAVVPRAVTIERPPPGRRKEPAPFQHRSWQIAPRQQGMRYTTGGSVVPDLRNPREIRRGILAAELLGPPRSLREHGLG